MKDWPVWLSWFGSFGWLTWLDQHNGAVIAIVTAVYAIFTVLLWLATKRQATLTQRIFEASNRPYVSVWAKEGEPQGSDTISFSLLVENVGSVPAEVIDWVVSATLSEVGGEPRPVEQITYEDPWKIGAALFPGREYLVRVMFVEPGLLRSPLQLYVRVLVKYRGPSERVHQTILTVLRRQTEQQRQQTTAT